MKPHLWNFSQAVRLAASRWWKTRCLGITRPLACHIANESYFRKAAVGWHEASRSIKELASRAGSVA